MDGRAFTSHRCTASECNQGQRHLAGSDAQREQATPEWFVVNLQRGNRLRNTRTPCGLEETLGQPGEQGKSGWRNQEWPIRAVLENALEQTKRPVGQMRKTHCGKANQDCTGPEQDASAPLHG